jgi:membrane protein
VSFAHAIDQTLFVFREALRAFGRNRDFNKAATLTYFGIFSLFPLLLLSLFLMGRFVVTVRAAADGLDRIASQVFPVYSETIVKEVRALAEQRAWGLLSVLFLFVSVMPLATVIRDTLADIFKTGRTIPFLKARVLDIVATLVMLSMLLLLVAGEVFYPALTAALAGRVPRLWRLLDLALPTGVALLILVIVHLVFSPVRLKPVQLLAGCLVTAVLLAIIIPLFTAFVRFNPNYGFMFGSLKAVFLLLVWIDYGFIALLLGAEVMAAIRRREALFVRGLIARDGRPDRHINRLTQYAVSGEPGDVVFREGDEGQEVFYVAEGAVSMTRNEQTLRVFRKGEYFGEMAMFLNARRTATATVVEPATRLIRITYVNTQNVFREDPDIMLALLREMAQRLDATSGTAAGE